MNVRVLEVAIYVDDIERSLAFYQRLFGFEVIGQDARLVALGVGGHNVILLCLRGASASLPHGNHDATGRQHVAFAIEAAALETWASRLAEQHLTIEERRSWPRGATSLYFRDPDGHLLELATPGVWSIY